VTTADGAGNHLRIGTTMITHPTEMLNSMRAGRIYNATTSQGHEFTGEYLGYEVVHGEWSILLRCDDVTVSVPLDQIDTVLQAA